MENVLNPQVGALLILVGVLAWAFAHFHASKKASAIIATVKAEVVGIERRVEEYSDAEIAKLSAALVARLADTSEQIQAKADADATIARKGALLARIQAAVAAAAVKTS